MLAFTITFFFLCAGALSSPTLYKMEEAEHLFEKFIQDHGRQYASKEEKQTRFEIFKQSLHTINAKNLHSDHAVFGINQFADVSKEDFSTITSCLIRNENWTTSASCEVVNKVDGADAPDSFDWRDNSAVTRVKNQADCGSCWAFSTTGNVEGQYAIKYKELVEFSEQQLVECDGYDHGCDGGLMTRSSQWLIENGGSMTEADYPYEPINTHQCRQDSAKVKAKVVACKKFEGITEDDLLQLVHSQGPLMIGIDATDLQHYHNGVMPDCSNARVDHAVLLVGYGTENGTPYWIIKNSWGDMWGENGYFRIKRGSNQCAIITSGLIVTVLVQ